MRSKAWKHASSIHRMIPDFSFWRFCFACSALALIPNSFVKPSAHRAVGVEEMVSHARKTGLAARCSKSNWEQLSSDPLPGIAALRNGSFLVLGKVTGDTAIVLAPHAARPVLMTRADFEAIWDGRLIL